MNMVNCTSIDPNISAVLYFQYFFFCLIKNKNTKLMKLSINYFSLLPIYYSQESESNKNA